VSSLTRGMLNRAPARSPTVGGKIFSRAAPGVTCGFRECDAGHIVESGNRGAGYGGYIGRGFFGKPLTSEAERSEATEWRSGAELSEPRVTWWSPRSSEFTSELDPLPARSLAALGRSLGFPLSRLLLPPLGGGWLLSLHP
jgi:hypothetical protein